MTADAHPLTNEQIAALDPGVRLIEAGPGTGKTKAVVARFHQQATTGDGVALLSFTNAAVDVAKARCRDVPGLAEAPNFVGTFDQFFHRYVVTPSIRREGGKAPRYVTTYDDLPSHFALVRPPSGGFPAIPLSKFAPSASSGWDLDPNHLSFNVRSAWEKITEWSRKQVIATAGSRISGLHAAHIFDTAEARRRALELLSDATNGLLTRLARRFSEVIVDEFQDCDEVEHELLELLHSAGIRVVAVADPDQAIYEFRQVSSSIYEQFRDNLDPSEVTPLTTCFRSTAVICELVTSLRAVGQHAVVAHPDNSGSDRIHVVVGSGIKAGSEAFKIIRQSGIPGNATRVIAHRKSDARALSRAGKQPPNGTSNVEPMLAALIELRSGADPRIRLRAIRRIEAFVLNLFDWPDADDLTTREDQLASLGITSDQLRVVVSMLLSASHEWDSKTECSASLRAIVESFGSPLAIDLVSAIGRQLMISDKVWQFWTSRTQGVLVDVNAEAIRWGHVHGVKGGEFEGVVLAIPPNRNNQTHVLDDWKNGINSEQRRVLYVGASRARRVLVIVTPKSKSDELTSLLTGAGIDFDVTEVK